jgi:hypothetical protein
MENTTAKTITHGGGEQAHKTRESSATGPVELSLPRHGLNTPSKDHCRREGPGPRTPNTLVTVEDPPPFAIHATQPLRSERQRAYASRCEQTLCNSINVSAVVRTESWEALAWPGLGTSYQAMSTHVFQKMGTSALALGSLVYM